MWRIARINTAVAAIGLILLLVGCSRKIPAPVVFGSSTLLDKPIGLDRGSEERPLRINPGLSQVKANETLYGIAELKLGDAKNWSLIYEWNKEVMDFDSTLIYPYQILQIKTQLEINENNNENKSTYLVKQGDSLWDIATKVYGDPYAWQLIVHDNKVLFDDPNKIIINQKLMIRPQL